MYLSVGWINHCWLGQILLNYLGTQKNERSILPHVGSQVIWKSPIWLCLADLTDSLTAWYWLTLATGLPFIPSEVWMNQANQQRPQVVQRFYTISLVTPVLVTQYSFKNLKNCKRTSFRFRVDHVLKVSFVIVTSFWSGREAFLSFYLCL